MSSLVEIFIFKMILYCFNIFRISKSTSTTEYPLAMTSSSFDWIQNRNYLPNRHNRNRSATRPVVNPGWFSNHSGTWKAKAMFCCPVLPWKFYCPTYAQNGTRHCSCPSKQETCRVAHLYPTGWSGQTVMVGNSASAWETMSVEK